MIDENKIAEAADLNADKYNPCRSTLDKEEACRASFKDGVEWFKKNIWHDASEEPEINKKLVVQCINYMGDIDYEEYTNDSLISWKDWVISYRILKWCYIKDILPLVHDATKGGDK